MPKSPHGYDTKSWSPVTGCSKVSAGCKNCWAEEYSRRMGWPWKVTVHPERLDEPLHWRKPQVVATCFMGDLFHEDVPDDFIFDVFDRMARCQRHTFLLLTKRPRRMLDFCRRTRFIDPSELAHLKEPGVSYWPNDPTDYPARSLPNVYLGVSVEDQPTAEERILLLLETPAAHRWVSAEPLLSAVDVTSWLPCGDPSCAEESEVLGWLDAVVVGGESGPNHRPCDAAWVQSIVDQCDAAGVPVYVKQGAGRYPGRQYELPDELWARKELAW